jgi:hypothetical protein
MKKFSFSTSVFVKDKISLCLGPFRHCTWGVDLWWVLSSLVKRQVVHFGKKFGGYLKSYTLIYHLIQQYHSWGYTQKNVTQVTPEALAHPCLLWHYSQ